MTDLSAPTLKRKLIEVSLPLEAINREAAREKSLRHGHPSTLHLWWARRPLAAARAVLFAQLVDDPSAHPDRFPTDELQRKERERLHALLERLVVWENTHDKKLFDAAQQEILRSTGGSPPPVLDPFAGGGSIPLEAQRLGLETHASDLNPVSVLINKALVEVPPKFRDRAPVFPGLAESQIRRWEGTDGLRADVAAYGAWVRDEAARRIGHLYPKAALPNGVKADVIAWIWARTVACPNPACRVDMPLARSWSLGKKKGKEAFIVPRVVPDSTHPSGKRIQFSVSDNRDRSLSAEMDGTVGRNGATCVACRMAVELTHIRAEGRAGRIGHRLMATVAEGARQRLYLAPTHDDETAAEVACPPDVPEGSLPSAALGFRVQAYGMTAWSELFTNRQLVALTTFSDLVKEVQGRVHKDAMAAGVGDGARLEAGGDDGGAYADAVTTLLAFALDRMAMSNSSLGRWNPVGEKVQHMFGRQAISMVWDFPEVTPFGSSTGSWVSALDMVANGLLRLPTERIGIAEQADASVRTFDGFVLSTDPPYYDNVGYADLSDFFYVWLRRTLRTVYPRLLSTMLVPKADELVADPFRHPGNGEASRFFETGFRQVFARARRSALSDFPITVYYAFKQNDTGDAGTASSGWETLLDGMIQSGWLITSTWPVRSEMATRMRGQASNALASSIVLSLRPRPDHAPTTDRRGFITALHSELPSALRRLQEGAIAPVDMPQAAIGPGMAVFSRYAFVIEADGSTMTVRSALARINEILDQVLAEQEGDFDATTRFAIAWYREHGYGIGKFGDADNLARARNTSVEAMDRAGILTSRAGKVSLIRASDTPSDYDVLADRHVSTWEVLHHLIRRLGSGGVSDAGAFLGVALAHPGAEIEGDLLKELAFLLFSVAEKNGSTKDAVLFNDVATAWPDLLDAARGSSDRHAQPSFDFEESE